MDHLYAKQDHLYALLTLSKWIFTITSWGTIFPPTFSPAFKIKKKKKTGTHRSYLTYSIQVTQLGSGGVAILTQVWLQTPRSYKLGTGSPGPRWVNKAINKCLYVILHVSQLG